MTVLTNKPYQPFLIDRKGRIRYKNLRGDDLEEAVKKLIAEK